MHFADFNYQDLNNFLTKDLSLNAKEASMRTNQIWKFFYQKGYQKIDLFSNLSKDLKSNLSNFFLFHRPHIKKKQVSKDGTIKWLIELDDKNLIETVYIPSETHATLCVSSQVGCSLNCKFCHTGSQKMVKNLSTNEIINQVLIAKDEIKDWSEQKLINNIVFMGMGEPFYNFDNIKKSIEILKDKFGLNFTNHRITVSTSGITTKIVDAAKEIGTYLAISLHAPNDKIRTEIMPINKKYKINDLIESCNYYYKINKEKIFLEYVLLKNVNDSEDCAKELAKLMGKIPSKLNLIEFNPWPGVEYHPSDKEDVDRFISIIKKSGQIVTLRKSRGKDILGACGQLKTESQKINL